MEAAPKYLRMVPGFLIPIESIKQCKDDKAAFLLRLSALQSLFMLAISLLFR